MCDFWEDLTPTLEDEDFRHYFWINKQTLLSLCNFLNPKCRWYFEMLWTSNCNKICWGQCFCFSGCQLPFKQLIGFFRLLEGCLMRHKLHNAVTIRKVESFNKMTWKEDFPAIAEEFNKEQFWYFIWIFLK